MNAPQLGDLPLPRVGRSSWPACSGVEGGAHQVAELVVGDGRGVDGPQPDGPGARLELGVSCDEAGVAALVPAVDRHPMLPNAEEEAATADLVGGHLV